MKINEKYQFVIGGWQSRCSNCGKNIITRNTIEENKLGIQKVVAKFKCPHCGKKFEKSKIKKEKK